MQVIFIIIGIIALFILAYILIVHFSFTSNILYNFKHCNVIVAGKKGSGKDLLFQWVIKHRKKQGYYANIDYGYKYQNIKLHDVSCYPNTYLTIINDKVEAQPHTLKEKNDIYISDIGIFLPSYMDSTLYKLFPSMPI